MRYKVVFERAGNGSQADCDRVRDALIAALRTPPDMANAMVSRAPLVVKQGLDRGQAEAYKAALESVGAAVSIFPVEDIHVFEPPPVPILPTINPQAEATLLPLSPPPTASFPTERAPSATDPPFAPLPVPSGASPSDWRTRLRVLNPPFDEPARGATPMTAGRVRASGDGFTLAHPMLERIHYQEILLISVFRSEAGRYFIDLYCPGQNRPTRLEASLIRFDSFGLPEARRTPDSVLAFVEMLLERNSSAMPDLPTFRFLQDPNRVKCVPTEREMEKYVARLTADLLTPETARPDANLVTAQEAETLVNAPDPWLAPSAPMFAPGPPPIGSVPATGGGVEPSSPYAPPLSLGATLVTHSPQIDANQPLRTPPSPPLAYAPSVMPRPYQTSVSPAPPGAVPPVRTAPPVSMGNPPSFAPPLAATHNEARSVVQNERPLWIRVGLLGASSRRMAKALSWIAIVFVVGLIVLGLGNWRFFFAAPFAGIVAFWYWACIRWMDQRSGWR